MRDSVASVKQPRAGQNARWLLLIHQIPPKPDYFRVKVRRRLQRIGAVALKNSVYVLPLRPQGIEDFRWLLREIVADGGEATLCEAAVLEGISQSELEAMFSAERDTEYGEIIAAAERGETAPPDASEPAERVDAELARLRRRLEEVQAIDYFGASRRAAAERALARLELRQSRPVGSSGIGIDLLRGHTWVTRRDVFVDRIGSAWLIRQFIDPKARFKFVNAKNYRPRKGEVRFDMFEAEYTHEGDRCTFETLLARAELRDRGLRALAEIVHDIDCKDAKFGREEAPGVAAMIRGISRVYPDDAARLERGAAAFDHLYASLR